LALRRQLKFLLWNVNCPSLSGTGQRRRGYPGDLLNRVEPAFSKNPTVIDRAWGTGRRATFKIEIKNSLEVVMPSRNESTRAIARLQLETPISDDTSLVKLEQQAAAYVREAKRRAPSEPAELVSSVVDAVARDYFRHAVEKYRKRMRRALPVLLLLSAMTLFAAPAIAQTDYDGAWNVTVITRTGSCQPTASYPLVVADGNVSGAADLSGSVGRNGVVRASLRGAFANGQLSGNAGSGRWNAASAGMPCSGRWMATRP
jgi:hypothetical protein